MKDKIWIKYYKKGIITQEVTFKEAELEIEKRRKELIDLGVKKGDRIIVKYENSPLLIFTYLALYKINAIIVPVHFKEEQERLDFIIKDSKALGTLSEDGFVKSGLKDFEVGFKVPQNISTIIYTSGTTGAPKGVCLTIENWKENAKSLIKHHRLNSKVVFASPLLLSHCNSHGLAMFSTYLSKTTYILFDNVPRNFLDILKEERVNVVSIVPAILHQLYKDNPGWSKFKELKYILTAAAPLSAELFNDVIDFWKVKIIQGFGLSESTNFSCTMPININHSLYKKVMRPYPSIGIAISGSKINIGKNVENVSDELEIYSQANFSGYWNKNVLKKQTVVKSGDIGYFKIFNGKKFYYLNGRIKEIINRGGEKIIPIEIEKKLRKLGLNSEIAIFGMPDEKYGEEVAIATVGKINKNIFPKLPKHMRPKKTFMMEKLFYTATGKVQRNKIKNFLFPI